MKGTRRGGVVESVELMMGPMTQKDPAARFLMKRNERRHGVTDPLSNGL